MAVHRPATAPPLLTLGHEWGGAYAWLGSCGCTPPPRPLRGACRELQIWQVGRRVVRLTTSYPHTARTSAPCLTLYHYQWRWRLRDPLASPAWRASSSPCRVPAPWGVIDPALRSGSHCRAALGTRRPACVRRVLLAAWRTAHGPWHRLRFHSWKSFITTPPVVKASEVGESTGSGMGEKWYKEGPVVDVEFALHPTTTTLLSLRSSLYSQPVVSLGPSHKSPGKSSSPPPPCASINQPAITLILSSSPSLIPLLSFSLLSLLSLLNFFTH